MSFSPPPAIRRAMSARTASILRGTVHKVDGDGRLWVVVPAVYGDEPSGPHQAVEGVTPAAVGDRVLVVTVDDDPGDLVVVGRLIP